MCIIFVLLQGRVTQTLPIKYYPMKWNRNSCENIIPKPFRISITNINSRERKINTCLHVHDARYKCTHVFFHIIYLCMTCTGHHVKYLRYIFLLSQLACNFDSSFTKSSKTLALTKTSHATPTRIGTANVSWFAGTRVGLQPGTRQRVTEYIKKKCNKSSYGQWSVPS